MTPRVVDVQAFIDAQRVSPLQRRLLFLCFLVIAIDGFDTAIIGFIAPAIRGGVAARRGAARAALRRGTVRADARCLRGRPARRPPRPQDDARGLDGRVRCRAAWPPRSAAASGP